MSEARKVGIAIVPLALVLAVIAGVLFSTQFLSALADNNDVNWPLRYGTLLAHFGVVVLLFFNWHRQWARLLAKAA